MSSSDHKGDKLYSKTEIEKLYKGDYQVLVLENTALKVQATILLILINGAFIDQRTKI